MWDFKVVLFCSAYDPEEAFVWWVGISSNKDVSDNLEILEYTFFRLSFLVPGTGRSFLKWWCKFRINPVESVPSVLFSVKNYNESQNGSPTINSANVAAKWSFQTDRIPSKIVGSTSVQRVVLWQRIAAFSWRWNRSTISLAWGWYAVVRMCIEPISALLEKLRL